MKRFRGPVSTCGFRLAPKHLPHCTKAFRDGPYGDGCWCDIWILSEDFKKPTARQWRAGRRAAVRARRVWAR